MMRCLDLARCGLGTTYPNPQVGSVIVRHGKIIAEGFHRRSGEPHAEALAIAAVKDKSLLKGSSLYVSLEPCSHFGKTPPCADLIVSSGIPRVVVGTLDTSKKVAGKGIGILRAGGCEVVTGVLEKECRRINRRFFTWHEKSRPYIILKWAESADGFMDRKRNPDDSSGPDWISGPLGRQLVHKWRSEEQSILVGTRTAQIDDPSLTVREWTGRQPLRLVIDRKLSLPETLNLFNDKAPTLIFNSRLNRPDSQPEYIKLDFNGDIIDQILEVLYQRQIQSVIIEGGADTIERFIKKELWDEARVFTGKMRFYDGIQAPRLAFQVEESVHLHDSVCDIYFRESDR
ncbi:MAG: bifunctional diaminohydroxyphosphoribosylaminopyrimidine deaminase/5-amino-6-(5-phosphoribosylamino)uracil reductase RibD [Chlorobi bacterium]|nr:bifunctional diaminohydroxyphosphoribosylaminopyrimidine deaminase/5-amino-6-(5-phosphoribosylamino)uracil reductase RibD [Chlorobiota bacterium]